MLGLLLTLTTSALGAPVEVQFGAHVDGNHSQGYGLSRVGVGLDATLRYQRVGVELAGWEAIQQQAAFERQPVNVQLGFGNQGENSVMVKHAAKPFPRRGVGLSAVWSPLEGEVGGLPMAVDLTSGLALTHHENGLMITTEAAGLFGTALRISTGRAGALRLRVRSMARLASTGFDPAVPTYQRRLDVRAAPDVGWTVRL